MSAYSTDNENKAELTSADTAHNLMRHVQEKSLKAAGIAQIIGDSALLAYGASTGSMKVGSVGLLGYTIGLIGLRYGNPKAEKQLQQIERHLGAYLRQHGVEIPNNPTTESLSKEGGVIDHVESFLYQYPSQMMNACFGLMGVQFAREGMHVKSSSLKISGGLLMAAALCGLLLKEKKPDPDHPLEGLIEKAWGWVEEKPLRLSGALMNLNVVGLTLNALEERKRNPAQKSYIFKLVAVASLALCNILFALSSKSQGGGGTMDEKSLKELARASACVIAAQPVQVQNALIKDMADFLSHEPHVHMNADEITTILRSNIEDIGKPLAAPKWQERSNTVSATPQSAL